MNENGLDTFIFSKCKLFCLKKWLTSEVKLFDIWTDFKKWNFLLLTDSDVFEQFLKNIDKKNLTYNDSIKEFTEFFNNNYYSTYKVSSRNCIALCYLFIFYY